MFMPKRLLPITVILCLLLLFSTAFAQDAVTITLAVPEPLQAGFGGVLERFESENPGIQVQMVTAPTAGMTADLEGALQSGLTAAQTADVLLVSRIDLRPDFTRAGYFLDLKPLADSDPAFNRDDFYPALRTAYEWDGGLWALPIVADSVLTVYSPAAFDAAGLTYPDGNWTIDDYANAARALAQTDGETTTPGLWVNSFFLPLFFRGLLGQDFADTNVIPAAPDLATPERAALLATWNDLLNEGVATTDYVPGVENAPLQVNGSYLLSPVSNAANRDALPRAALLPGNSAGLEAFGVAVSAGTAYPDAAYTLAKFLTGAAELHAILPAGSLARQTVTGDVSGSMDFAFPPETQAVLDEALNVGFSNVALLYQDYINTALNAVRAGQDPLDALTAAQTQAAADMQTTLARRDSTVVVVATPVPEVVVAADEVSLNFAMWNNTTELVNRADWERVIAEFVAADPQVANIQFNYITPTSPNWREGIEQSNDCMFAPENDLGFSDLSLRLPLDPLLNADPNFDPNDMVNGALAQVQRDGATWALPVGVKPYVLRYDAAALAEAGITVSPEGWTINQFVDALNVVKPLVGDAPAFYPDEYSGNHLLMLVAAFGALPLDERTNPPTVDFTSPATVDAIRQALDLAKNGLMHYEEMARAIRIFNTNPPGDARVIYGDTLSQFDSSSRTSLAAFPHGDLYTPLTFNVSTAYISATSQNPEACYRWLQTIAQHPELFTGMPARRSLIGGDALRAAQGESAVAAYQQINQVLASPEAVVFSPVDFAGLTTRLWLMRAFDRYVLQNADLEVELAEAQRFTQEFLACTAAIPPDDPERVGKRADCAVRVDPTVAANVGH
jgi:ABC-type glycerol-3-phosphate transport system substrate-binding protein